MLNKSVSPVICSYCTYSIERERTLLILSHFMTLRSTLYAELIQPIVTVKLSFVPVIMRL